MPLAGFSEDDVPLAIGYHLGLRWFQARLTTHDKFEVSLGNWDGGVHAACSCGHVTIVESISDLNRWWDDHSRSGEVVLNGSRGRWTPGLNHATCNGVAPSKEHPVPNRECSCGFWAYWRLGAQQASHPHVAGLIKGTGRMVRGPAGFRCAKAEVVALVMPSPGGPPHMLGGVAYEHENIYLALALEQTYKVPVYSSIEALLEEHKPPDGQPELGDDWFGSMAQQRQQWATGGAVSSGSGYTRSNRTWHSGAGNVSFTHISGISAGGGAGGSGYSPGGSNSVASNMGMGAAPCLRCGRIACSTGQALCASCQLKAVSGKLKELEAGVLGMQQAAITGAEALSQLSARRAAWDKGSGGDGHASPELLGIQRMLNYIRSRYGRKP